MTAGRSIGRVGRALAFWPVAIAAAMPMAGVSAQERPSAVVQHEYDIPAERLDMALATFARISNVDILYDNGLATGRRSTTVSGRYSPPQALAILLSGTGLSWRFTKARAVVIYAANAGAAPGAPPATHTYRELVLDTLHVRATPVVGTQSRAAFTAYSEWVLAELYRRITPDRGRQRRPFRGKIQFWIDEQGVVSRLEFLRRTGDAEADRLIENRIVGTRFDRTPPRGLPQPLRFMVEGRR